jgi:predicted nucleic acid-binding protein
MRKVVSNTTPILSLLKIGKLDVLRHLYGRIMIPQAVYREIEAGNDKDYYADVGNLDWIEITPIQSTLARPYLFDLDDGEAETIMLAKEQNADLAIIDEKLGRRYAVQLNIPITGTIGILLRAKELGLITSVAPLLQELRDKSSWIDDNLFKNAIRLANEL